MAKLKPPSVVCLDVGGTMIHARNSFAAAVQCRHGLDIPIEVWDRCVNLAAGPLEDDLARLAEAIGVAVPALTSIVEEQQAMERALYDDVLPFLSAVRGIPCIVFSNVARWLSSQTLCGAEAFVSGRYYSFELGACKPDPAAFAFVSNAVGADPAAMLMIGDSLRCDYEAALRAGWMSVLVDRAGAYAGRADLVRVGSLLDVPALWEAEV